MTADMKTMIVWLIKFLIDAICYLHGKCYIENDDDDGNY